MGHRPLVRAGIFGGVVLSFIAIQLAAGPLDPPSGPVTSTAGPEPRIAINGANAPGDADSLFKITQPGSYYLTGNITGVIDKHGIEIAASNVTIDLMGFTLRGVTGSKSGIATTQSGIADVGLTNGFIVTWTMWGVELAAWGTEASVSRIRATENGSGGIHVSSNSSVVQCEAVANGGAGISASSYCAILDCVTNDNASQGIVVVSGAVVSRCTSGSNEGDGFFGTSDNVLESCSAVANFGDGFHMQSNSTIRGCSGSRNRKSGIEVWRNCIVEDNVCAGNGTHDPAAAGIFVNEFGSDNKIEGNACSLNPIGIDIDGTRNVIDGNRVSNNNVGFDIDGSANLVIRNSASSNTPNYTIGAGNSVAPRIGVVGSDGWAGITNADHPWANLGH